jgi:hypothetical protein
MPGKVMEHFVRFDYGFSHLYRRDYQKDRFAVRPPFDLENTIDRSFVERISPESIRGVGRKSNDATGLEQRNDLAVCLVFESFGALHLHPRIVLLPACLPTSNAPDTVQCAGGARSARATARSLK